MPGGGGGTQDQVTLGEIEHFAYCHHQWGLISMDGEWTENRSTAVGRIVHERVDQPEARAERGRTVVRGLAVWSDEHGLVGRADAVELGDDVPPFPIEYKSGRRAMAAATVQLAAQAICLEEMFRTRVNEGAIWLHGARRRRLVDLNAGLKDRALRYAEAIRAAKQIAVLPPAQFDARCRDCSLINECLPGSSPIAGEWSQFIGHYSPRTPATERNPRMRELLNCLYVNTPGTVLHLDHDAVLARCEDVPLRRVPLRRLEGISAIGRVTITTPLIHRCAEDGITISWLTSSGRHAGTLRGRTTGNILLRQAQHRHHDDHGRRIEIARSIVAGKILNAARYARHAARLSPDEAGARTLRSIATELDAARPGLPGCESLDSVRGVEGAASRLHFSAVRHRCTKTSDSKPEPAGLH